MGAESVLLEIPPAQTKIPAEIYPEEIESLLSGGATLFDVSEASGGTERAKLVSMHPKHVPLSRLGDLEKTINQEKPVIFCCRSGLLSYQAAKIAAHWTRQPVYYLPGGFLSVIDG